MTIDELLYKLSEAGHRATMPYLNGGGRPILLVDNVAMFQHDAQDLLIGKATVEEICTRNVGADLGWTYPDEK